MTRGFKPIFTITNRITAGLTRIERARGFLEAATLSENWIREMGGRVPYLEKVINCNLAPLSRLLWILRFHPQDLKLVPSVTVSMRWGKGPKKRLRFTKTGDPKPEEAYSRRFVCRARGRFTRLRRPETAGRTPR